LAVLRICIEFLFYQRRRKRVSEPPQAPLFPFMPSDTAEVIFRSNDTPITGLDAVIDIAQWRVEKRYGLRALRVGTRLSC
jgi:hypothetical protein